MANRCFFLMSEWPSHRCQVHRSTSSWTSREWDAKYMWGIWDSSQVLILTIEFSFVVSQWPHHLMPLNCFSLSLFLHSYPLIFFFLSLPRFPPGIPSSASISTVSSLLYISPLAHSSPLIPPRSPPPPLPGEWQAHKCSNDSGGGVSVTAIEAVTGAGLSLGANTASASVAEPLSPRRQRGRERDGQRGKKTIGITLPHYSLTRSLSLTKQSPWL